MMLSDALTYQFYCGNISKYGNNKFSYKFYRANISIYRKCLINSHPFRDSKVLFLK